MVSEPQNYDHGERQCRVRDPFGHEWLLGQDISGASRPGVRAGGTPNIFPGLRYRDEHAAMDWLARAFGFARHAVYTDDAGRLLHAELKLGPGILMLGSGPEDTLGFSIYVYVQDLDAHFARATAAGAEIVRPLADTSYGSREFAARDLDGHVWYFGTYQPAE